METWQRDFNLIWKQVCEECLKKYGIEVGNNAKFVGETIFGALRKRSVLSYVECGVYEGTTFFPIYHVLKRIFSSFSMVAIDSFSGFPNETLLNKNDEFEKFEILFREGVITRDHLNRARVRCSNLKNKEHIQKDYFAKYEKEFFRRAEGKREINIVKCSFSDLKTRFTNGRDKYDLVFLDCDLYLSYKYCLDFFNNKTEVFIFDEYFSLKYPGARIACDEFVTENSGWKFFKKIERNPYFERWGIKKDR